MAEENTHRVHTGDGNGNGDGDNEDNNTIGSNPTADPQDLPPIMRNGQLAAVEIAFRRIGANPKLAYMMPSIERRMQYIRAMHYANQPLYPLTLPEYDPDWVSPMDKHPPRDDQPPPPPPPPPPPSATC